jgi:hypothetical protein
MVMMRAEVHKEVVLLRWAPNDAKAWRLLNKYGVRLERLTVSRDGQVLDQPETRVLHGMLKPEESDQFKQIASEYSYGAIMAQAIFGESFVVTGGGKQDISSIIALSEELQQRYVLSLYAADLCFPAALVAGWGFEDEGIRPNEKYLYGVVPLVPEKEMQIAPGAVFVDTERLDRFVKPLDFTGEFEDGNVRLAWNSRTLEWLYSAYILERSTDGKNFQSISDTPITQMQSGLNDRIVYIDSIRNDISYSYRICGLTPFGTKGAWSDTLSGAGRTELQNPPFISKAMPDEHGGAQIEWTFDAQDETLIEGFTLERSDDDKTYSDFIPGIGKKERSLTLSDLPSTNYFVLAANTTTGKRVRSFPVLVQPVDTIPPAVPVGLTAKTDTSGVVRLFWQPNRDKGRFGYRIFRGRTAEEEMMPLNDNAIQDTMFVDSVDMRSLNGKMYYAIVALDSRYNRSDYSAVVEVKMPEIIPPTPPFIRKISVENGRNVVMWVSGGETVLAGYDLYRKGGQDADFVLLAAVASPDSCTYTDTAVENNRVYVYRVQSRSEGGLVSAASLDYKVTAISKGDTKTAMTLTLSPAKDRVKLIWEIPVTDAVNIQLYKKVGDGTFALFLDMLDPTGAQEDTDVVPGSKYHYMLVLKTNNAPPQSTVKTIAL